MASRIIRRYDITGQILTLSKTYADPFALPAGISRHCAHLVRMVRIQWWLDAECFGQYHK